MIIRLKNYKLNIVKSDNYSLSLKDNKIIFYISTYSECGNVTLRYDLDEVDILLDDLIRYFRLNEGDNVTQDELISRASEQINNVLKSLES